MPSEMLESRVRLFVAAKTGVDVSRVNRDSDIFMDLGVDGFDAQELLKGFVREFEVPSDAVRFERHFGPEAGFNPLALLFPSWWRWQRHRIPIKIAVLIQFARTKAWAICYESPSQ